ncbi:MAG TPA: 23S rRNA methyltransferase [Alphaproteobacteria bacterium]|nr:23S rRNA methyltransferase [Alphaproteobacteria bacterium]
MSKRPTGKGQKRGKSAGGVAGSREARQRVKTARGRSNSSTRWLERQLNDPYVAAAKRDGYRSRAAYKLREIDDRFRFLKKGARVVDLGSTPGGWTQVCVERIFGAGVSAASSGERGIIVAVDINEMEPVTGAKFLQLDFLDNAAPALVKQALGGQADVILSDMAAPATGHRATDHLRVMALCEVALLFAIEVLAVGGAFCAKVLRGGADTEILNRLKQEFSEVRHYKPESSRSDSKEIYVVATGFKDR